MKFWRAVEVIGCFALLTCVFGIVLLSAMRPAIQAAFQAVEADNINAFLSGKTNTYRGFDSASIR